jgi:peptidase C13-like protein
MLFGAAALPAATYYVTIGGLGGEPEYEQRFSGWAKDIDKALKSVPDAKVDTLYGPAATRDAIRGVFNRIGKEAKPQDALVVMLIGHGSYDGADYKINLPGPDLSAIELASLLDRMPPTRQLVVNMTSASGGAIDALRKENRVIVTATKTGTEKNATVFARYWVEALNDPAADTDKNETVSALEAFRYADQKTGKFYETQKRIATEHALLEDTGKGEGVRAPSPENGEGMLASAFPLLRLGSNASAAGNPQKLKLLAQKEELEQQIDRLKYQKAAMPSEEYKRQLGALLLQLAKTQAELDQ